MVSGVHIGGESACGVLKGKWCGHPSQLEAQSQLRIMSAMLSLFCRALPFNTVSGGRRYLFQSTRTHAIQHELKQQPIRARQVSSLSPTLLLLGFMPVFTFGLGIWQIQRLKWKVNLIDELTQTLQKPALLLPGTVEYVHMFLTCY